MLSRFGLRHGAHNDGGRGSREGLGPLSAILACLVLLLCCLPLPSQAQGEWSLCADTVWSGWGTTCCGANNLWAMGYCGSDNLFASSCPVVPLGVCPTLSAVTTLERTYTQSLVAGISLVRADGLDPPQTPANLTRLARGSACYIYGAGSSNDSSVLQSNRRRLIETFGYDYNFFDGTHIPCPVVTNVEELYASGGLPSAVMQRWLNNSTSADVLGSDYTAVGVGVFAGSPTKYVAIFVTVEDYTEIDTSLCPASKDDEF